MASPNTLSNPESPAEEAVGDRLQKQNKAVERFLRDSGNESVRKAYEHRNNQPVPKVRVGHVVYESPALDPSENDEPANLAALKIHDGQAQLGDLWRAYKHTPHQPTSVFLKYLVHRLNNLDSYDDPALATRQDLRFLEHHKAGGAAEKNNHLAMDDLHAWMKKHPGLPEQLLLHKAKLAAELSRGVGLNIRDINGEPYVAFTRGLNTDIMDHEHALSSWSDLVETGFGKVMHRAWVPLKDLWYSYQHGEKESGGDAGHENEYLVAHTRPRFEAGSDDVKQVRGHHKPWFYDNATDDELAAAAHDMGVLKHPNAGPKTIAAAQAAFGDYLDEGYLLPTKFRTREQALVSSRYLSVKNPNLTKDDLSQKAMQFSQLGTLDSVAEDLLEHPNATADTARAVAGQYVPDGKHERVLDAVAKSPLTPPDVLDRVLDRYEQVPLSGATVSHVLSNPNSTSAHADRVYRLSLDRHGPYHTNLAWFRKGRYSASLIQELSDRIAAGYGKEPLQTAYPGVLLNPEYNKAKTKFDADKERFAADHNALVNMGSNRDLDEDSVDALIDAAERHGGGMGAVLQALAVRQNSAPLSESNQLRLLRAMDSKGHHKGGRELLAKLAESKGLAPSVVWALALHHDPHIRETLYLNKTVDPELLARAWSKKSQTPEEYLAHATLTPGQWEDDPYHHLARAIRDRREYAVKRAERHFIKPWPQGLAKSETDWWPVKLREWMSSREKEDAMPGYFYRCNSMEEARAIFGDHIGR